MHFCRSYTKSLYVRLGEYNLATEDEPLNYIERKVNKFVKHPNYYLDEDNDIGLVKLDQPIEFQANIMPICLPQVDEDFKDKTAWVTGWGDLGL